MNRSLSSCAYCWVILAFGSGCGEAPGPSEQLVGAGALELQASGQGTLQAGPVQCSSLVAILLGRMTLAEKVGQMLLVDNAALSNPADVAGLALGGVLAGGTTDPPTGNDPRSWQARVAAMKQAALSSRLAIPILYGTDAVHGHSNVAGATIFPHNIGLGASGDAALVTDIARATASEVAATGIDWTFAPVVAAARDERWGRTYEAFSEAPTLAGALGKASVLGFQTAGSDGRPTILACAKHFAGDGGTLGGVDQGDTVGLDSQLFPLHLEQYKQAIAANVKTVMVSFSSWNGQRMHTHHHMLTDVLKGQLGFQGIVVSDWAGYGATPVESVNAGIDMLMVPSDYLGVRSALLGSVPQALPLTRVDDAVRRILSVKCDAGAFGKPLPEPSALVAVGSAEHRNLARRAVRESLVLLKNDGCVLPLPKTARLHVAGVAAQSLAQQCGGWTVGWQGLGDTTIPGTTILDAIRKASTGQVTYSADGSGAKGADVAIAVIGEQPYAEFVGDDQDLSLSNADVAVLDRLNASGMPVVTILLSGRPMIIAPHLQKSEAWLAA